MDKSDELVPREGGFGYSQAALNEGYDQVQKRAKKTREISDGANEVGQATDGEGEGLLSRIFGKRKKSD